jgi:hypothetical protein
MSTNIDEGSEIERALPISLKMIQTQPSKTSLKSSCIYKQNCADCFDCTLQKHEYEPKNWALGKATGKPKIATVAYGLL